MHIERGEHMEKAQEEGSGFKCDECRKICKSPETYRIHIKKTHLNSDVIGSDECGEKITKSH